MEIGLLNEIPQDIFTDLEQIGSGSFSDIFTATYIKTKTKVALKISIKSNDEEYLKREIDIHKSLHHPFICKYFTDIETEHLMIIAMEFIEGTNSLDYVNQYKGLPVEEAQNIFSQLVIVMEYMHEKNVSHRDLKLENIMIDKYAHIRLIDFGFSSLNTMMTTCCGSIPYCAPEILSGQNYTKSADIWSLGIILYAILQGYLPFYNSNINMLAIIICSNEPYFTSSMDPSARDLIIKMLIKDPEQRITLNEIKEHPFVKQSKLFQINYKQLFSPTPLENDNYKRSSLKISRQVNSNALIQQINGNIDHLHIAKSSTCLTFNFALTQHQKNCYHMRSRRTSNDFSKNHVEEDLHEKITHLSDNIDDCIMNRSDFAFNLNKLIEMAYINL